MPPNVSEIASEYHAGPPSLARVAQGAARRVLLLSAAPANAYSASGNWIHVKTPFGLYRLQTGITELQASIECRILPESFGGGDDETARLLAFCRDYQPAIIGISALSFGMKYALGAAAALKREFPQVPIILGGPHATSFPLGVARYSDFDYYVCGEGARSGAELIRALFDGAPELTTVHGIVYRGATALVQTAPRPFSKDLDWLPSLDWKVIDIGAAVISCELAHNSQFSYLFRRPTIILPVCASRGCPFQCAFCENIQHGPFQYFSVERVIAEIRSGVERFQGTDIQLGFFDNLIHFNRPWFMALLARIKAEFALPITAIGRADLLDFELIDFMAAHNVVEFHVFPESGSRRIRQEMKKDYNDELFMRNVRYFAQKDTLIFASFLVEWPGETLQERRETQALAAEPCFDACFINSLYYLAGSPIGRKLEEFGILPDSPEYFDYLDNCQLGRRLTAYSAEEARLLEQDDWLIIKRKMSSVPARKLARLNVERFILSADEHSPLAPSPGLESPAAEPEAAENEQPRLPGILKLLARHFAEKEGYRLSLIDDPLGAQRLALKLRVEEGASAIELAICLHDAEGPGRRTRFFQLIFLSSGFDRSQAAIQSRLLRELSLWEESVLAQKRGQPAPA